MESRYEILPDQNLIRKTHFGQITVDMEIDLLNRILTDERYRRGMSAVCDFTRAVVDWNLKDMDRFRAYMATIKETTGTSKWAVVATGGVTGATARVFITLNDAFGDTIKVKLFGSEQDALEWIGQSRVEEEHRG